MSYPKDTTYEIRVPTSVDDMVALRNDLATTPHGGAAVHVAAMLAYANDADLGMQCFTVSIAAKYLQDGPRGVKGKEPRNADQQRIRDRLGGKPYLARSYVQGTSPEGSYELPSGPLIVKVKEQSGDVGDEIAKVFVYSTGADSPRPIHLAKNNRGLWKATNWNSLEVGCRPPAPPVDDDI